MNGLNTPLKEGAVRRSSRSRRRRSNEALEPSRKVSDDNDTFTFSAENGGNTFLEENDGGNTINRKTNKSGRQEVTVVRANPPVANPKRLVYASREDASPWDAEITKVVIQEGVRKVQGRENEADWITNGAFSTCPNLSKVVFPHSLQSISKLSFNLCVSLVQVCIPDGVSEIGQGCFAECINLKTITLPKNLFRIADNLMCCCLSLRTIQIPASVISVGKRAFCGCMTLGSISFVGVSRCERIGENAMSRCMALKMVKLPPSIKEIAHGAFQNCTKLEKVELAEGLKQSAIANDCFLGCHNSLTLKRVKEPIAFPPKMAPSKSALRVSSKRSAATLVPTMTPTESTLRKRAGAATTSALVTPIRVAQPARTSTRRSARTTPKARSSAGTDTVTVRRMAVRFFFLVRRCVGAFVHFCSPGSLLLTPSPAT